MAAAFCIIYRKLWPIPAGANFIATHKAAHKKIGMMLYVDAAPRGEVLECKSVPFLPGQDELEQIQRPLSYSKSAAKEHSMGK